MVIARYTQSPDENIAYQVDYTSWLNTGETIASVAAAVTPVTIPALVPTTAILGTLVGASVTISGGLTDNDYTIKITTTTSTGQIKEDCIAIDVRTACE